MRVITLKKHVPWWGKVFGKVLLARIPVGYAVWQRFDLFKHGRMETPDYVWDVVTEHFSKSGLSRLPPDAVGVELGPGDSLSSAVVFRALGGTKLFLVDTGSYARQDVAPYRRMLKFVRDRGLLAGDDEPESLSAVLSYCQAEYLIEGLSSLRSIPDHSIDFLWSHAVLEHVAKAEFNALLEEMRRILKPSGVCSHVVDLQDHLGGALNNLRFSERYWESGAPQRSGFYTNRIGFTPMRERFEQAGFAVEVLRVDRWPGLPTPRAAMAHPFKDMDEDELRVRGFDVVLRPRSSEFRTNGSPAAAARCPKAAAVDSARPDATAAGTAGVRP